MGDVIPRQGKRVIIGSGYSARGFLIADGEVVPEDPRSFDRTTHAPRLVQLQKGEVCEALSGEHNGQLIARVERDGQTFACFLLPSSFDISG